MEDHERELREVMGEDGHEHVGNEVRKTIGDVASAFVAARRGAGIVLQASNGKWMESYVEPKHPML